ncbi:major facilitator superfamily transporter [Colletotrichum plurivorum]|uniref:Major facilitator superfamily transporter n=1 Tax=Colletotrichum plurivorum TaxID=2175906 RepID=A0A8H6MW27_9PEZI|nr:major facilitator superfamily transporter [Colletotrichum plurivorum]
MPAKPPPSAPAAPETEPLLSSFADEDDTSSSTINPEIDASDDAANEKITWRVAAAAYSFFVVGLFTSTVGVTIPHLQAYYHLSDIHVSAIFLVGPVGYIIASRLNDLIHAKLGQRGIAVVGPACHLFYALVAALRPPFAVLLAAAGVAGFGIGLVDGSWCAWVAALRRANTLSGLLHGSFSVGAAVCPYLVGLMLSAGGELWYQWFFVLAAAAALEFVFLSWAFRRENADRYNRSKLLQAAAPDEASKGAILRCPATWVYAGYLLVYVGAECTISGWIVAFMLRVRHASTYVSSVCSSAFWAGMAAGRLVLGALTDRLGVRRAVIVYLFFAPLLVVLFIVVRVLWFSVLSMAMLGFVMGPLFPSCIVQLVGLLPRDLHVGAVSFVASLGQVGGALLPYMLGAITQVAGLQAFQYMLLVQFAIMLVVWVGSFRLSATKEEETEERCGHQD